MFFGWLICWHAPLNMLLVDSENNSKTDRIPCLSAPRTPKHYALSFIHLLRLSEYRAAGWWGHKYGEWRRETEIVAGEWESEQQTHRGPWRLPITLPRAADRERQRDLVPRRPSYTMRLKRHIYIMCSIDWTGLVYVTCVPTATVQ